MENRPRAFFSTSHGLGHRDKKASDVEDAAAKAHVDPHALDQARADLGIVTSRSNAGGVQLASGPSLTRTGLGLGFRV
jgi:hypothetical protein